MTVIDDRHDGYQIDGFESDSYKNDPWAVCRQLAHQGRGRQQLVVRRSVATVRPARRTSQVRPGPVRPVVAPMRYRGSGVVVSDARHPSRPRVGTAMTVAVAIVAALITVWLGWLAHLGGVSTSASAAGIRTAGPEQLAVVHVQPGETIQQLASRMAPGAPVDETVERIRTLNHLDPATFDAGRTLIAPIG